MTRKTQTSRTEVFDEADAADEGAATRYPPGDAINYIRDMVGALHDMAEDADQPLLAYLLDMAHEEARLQARKASRAQNPAIGRA
ncbi:MAG: hypothetical protein Q8P46_01860 [Hyphomicrobiales bacterium]|nr:hypothetical protein [Hyphomicrobiales bacterium]